MARAIFIPSTNYPAGTISRSVDSFPADVREIFVRLTREAWPGTTADVVAEITVTWSSGSEAKFSLPGGIAIDERSGNPALVGEYLVPLMGGRKKRDSVSATITAVLHQPLRTAIQIEAR